MIKKTVWVSLLVSILLIASSLYRMPTALAFTEEQKLLLQSWRIVNQSYIDETFNHQNWWRLRQKLIKKPLNDRQQTYEAIETMLASLDDPYTRLLRPEQYRSLQINTSGELSGVGLQINLNQDKQIEVVAPLSGSPAAEAGIKTGDRIIAIDGFVTTNMSLDEAAARMRGKIGTSVSLTIKPADKDQTKEVEVVRDRIALNPVYANLDRSSSIPIGYVRLNQFSANAAQEIAHAVADLEQQGAQGYILDLRNNPGGLLQAGVEIARMWLDQGTVVYTVNRQGILGSFDSTGEALTDDPLVILVNRGTASASEILAGALQDNARALLVGEKTFGKGLIQSLFELPDGAGLAVTVAKYETPSHRDINKQGIEPDRVVTQEPISLNLVGTQADQQYQTALKILTTDSVIADAT